jgi:hypothetical protein
MEEKRRAPRFLAKWIIKCLCNCTNKEEGKKIYHGVSRDISALGISLVSNYNICAQKALSVQLTVPGLQKGDQDAILYIGSRTTYTVAKDGDFITGIEFLQFEQDGAQILREHLEKRFGAGK